MSENNKESGSFRFIVKTHDSEESVVVVFKNESDNTYSFVNLTKERIYSSKFVTVEEAIQNMNDQVRNGLIKSYIMKGNHPELSKDKMDWLQCMANSNCKTRICNRYRLLH